MAINGVNKKETEVREEDLTEDQCFVKGVGVFKEAADQAKEISLDMLKGIISNNEGEEKLLLQMIEVCNTFKDKNPYIQYFFIDGQGFLSVLGRNELEKKAIVDEHKKILDEMSKTSNVCFIPNYDEIYYKNQKEKDNVIDEAKEAADKAKSEYNETVVEVSTEVDNDKDKTDKEVKSDSSILDNTYVKYGLGALAAVAVVYGAYKLYEHITDDGDIIILDNDLDTDAWFDSL
ncbi:MAG: hypothetical protein AB7G52_04225 [Arcobacter sp.]